VRDLVDLVVIARTQTVQAAAPHHAIDAERVNRGLAPITTPRSRETSLSAPITGSTAQPRPSSRPSSIPC